MTASVISEELNVEDFWAWAVMQWSDSILSAEMMALQDEHQCVVLELLLMGWLGRKNFALSTAGHLELVATAAPWLDDVVIPLRATRHRWRGVQVLASQREQLQQLELKCEYALAELYFETLLALEPSDLVLTQENRVIDNLVIAFASLGSTVSPQRIEGLGTLLSP